MSSLRQKLGARLATIFMGAALLSSGLPALPDAHAVTTGPGPCQRGHVPAAAFTDVRGNTHAHAIACVTHHRIAEGLTLRRYGPAQRVSRAQMASFIARLIDATGHRLPASGNRFSDVNRTPHERNINRLAAAGVVNGTATGRYEPAAPVTRGQMASFLVRAHRLVTGKLLPAPRNYFWDDDRTTHERNINRAAHAGITGGLRPGVFGPTAAVPRDQMASFSSRLFHLVTTGKRPATPPRAVSRPPPDPLSERVVGVFQGRASWYGPGFAGRTTACGERFNPAALTAAHRTLPCNTRVRVTNLANNAHVIVRINDRGPYTGGRILDVSQHSAHMLGFITAGVTNVRGEILARPGTAAAQAQLWEPEPDGSLPAGLPPEAGLGLTHPLRTNDHTDQRHNLDHRP